MDSTTRQDLYLVGAALVVLAGAAVTLGQASAWTVARATGNDAGMTIAFGGVVLFAAGLGALFGSLYDLPPAGQLLLGGLGYVIALAIAILVLAIAVGSWEPILEGAVATMLFVAFCEVACREGTEE